MTDSSKRNQGGQKKPMPSGFPHQNPMQNFSFPRTDALPQHGQKPDKRCMKTDKPVRKATPRPGH